MKRSNRSRLAFREEFFAGRVGIQAKILLYLLVLAGFIISLIWLFQSALIFNFYQGSRTSQINAASNLILRNIDNEDLEILADRLGEENDLSILLLDDSGEELFSVGRFRFSAFREMSQEEIKAWAAKAPENGNALTETLTGIGSRRLWDYNQSDFDGNVPDERETNSRSILRVQRVTFQTGEAGTLMIYARVTPIRSTLETMQWQFVLVVVIILLATGVVGYTISKIISEPIIETNLAARELSRSRYTRPPHCGGYREIAQLNDTLVRTAEDLRRVEDLQRELIANISHDLRTPLTMIEGYAEVMRDIPDEATPENLQIIIDESNRLSSMVNEVLDFSRLRSGSLELTMTDFNLTELIREIANRISKMTAAEGYRLVFEPATEVTVNADSGRISQVIYNLVGNALTYTGEDRTVRIDQQEEGDWVRVRISDSGEGISKEELPYIWDRYYRSRENHRRAVIGSGLGLNICRGILENHHVDFGVSSEPGEGTTFWFMLRRAGENGDAERTI